MDAADIKKGNYLRLPDGSEHKIVGISGDTIHLEAFKRKGRDGRTFTKRLIALPRKESRLVLLQKSTQYVRDRPKP